MSDERRTLAEGDIIEFTHRGDRVTAEVMLLTDDGMVLLDFYDGDRPVATFVDRLLDVRIFDPELTTAA